MVTQPFPRVPLQNSMVICVEQSGILPTWQASRTSVGLDGAAEDTARKASVAGMTLEVSIMDGSCIVVTCRWIGIPGSLYGRKIDRCEVASEILPSKPAYPRHRSF